MPFKRRTSNSAQDNIGPNCAKATAGPNQDIPQTSDSTHARRYLRFARMLAQNATLLAVAVTLALLVSAYGQQEINPTWYEPWAAPNRAVAQHPQPRTANRKNQREIRSASAAGGKSRGKYVRTHLVITIAPTKLSQTDHINSRTANVLGFVRKPVR